jgi:uncharacterized membrane protein
MDGGCCAILIFILLGLAYLYQAIIVVFVVPINGVCDWNSTLPPDPPVDLTMESWIYGGMSAGVIMFAMFSACSRRTTNSDCAVGSLALLFIVYHIFMVVWSIIGLKLYANFY